MVEGKTSPFCLHTLERKQNGADESEAKEGELEMQVKVFHLSLIPAVRNWVKNLSWRHKLFAPPSLKKIPMRLVKTVLELALGPLGNTLRYIVGYCCAALNPQFVLSDNSS